MEQLKRFGVALGFVLALTLTAFAQSDRGTVVGTVKDPNGGLLSGANVKLTNVQTNVSREATTSDEGTYRFEAVEPGNYKIDVNATGFKGALVQNVISAAGQTTDYPVALEIGNPSEVVQVTSDTALLQSQDGARTNSIDTRQITELPISNLNPVNLVFTLPGVTDPGNKAGGFVQGTEFNVNGLRARNNNQLIDSLDNNDNGIAGQTYQPILVDGYNEVTVLQGDFSAEYGRAGGAVVNVITRSGTNEFHGSAYDLFDNSAFNSRTPGQRRRGDPKPRLTQNTFGGSLGGPIFKDKLFFFGTFQPQLIRSTVIATGTLPTAAGVSTLRSLFAPGANQNVDTYLNTIGDVRGVTKTFLVPLGLGRPDVEFGEASASESQPVDDYQGLFRIDWTPSAKNNYSFRYLFDKQRFSNQGFNGQPPLIFPGYEIDVPSLIQNFYFNQTHNFSPNVTNEFRFGYARTNVFFGPRNKALLDAGPQVVFASNPITSFNLDPTSPQGRIFNNYQFQDTVSYTVGNHTLRIGADLLKQKAREFVPFASRGTLTYTTGGGFEDFANFVDEFSGNQGQFGNKVFGDPVIYPSPFYQNYFINDTWRVRPNLTLNLGLRYENYGAPFNVIPFPAFGGFDVPITTRVEQKKDNNNFAPRFSFAYTPNFWKSVFGEDRTVIRGGFAVNYDFFFSNILDNTAASVPNANGFSSFGAAVIDVSPRGFPNSTINGSLPSTFVGEPDPAAGVTSMIPNLLNPLSYVWNFGIQRQLPWHMVADIAYVGSRGLHQFLNLELNPATGPLSNNLPSPRLHPDFGPAIIRTNSGDSVYHSLQTRLERQFSNGLFFRAAYTYSRAIDDVNSEVFTTTGGSTRPSDPFSLVGGLRADRSVASYDVPHRFVGTLLYDIPSPVKEGWARSVLGGFTFSAIYRIQSGNVDSPFVGGIDLNRDGSGFNDRPAINNPNAPPNSVAIRDFLFGDSSPTGYVDANDQPIALNDARYVVDRNIRTNIAGRNILRAPALSSVDVSLARSFRLPFIPLEGTRFQVRADFYNVFNRHQCAFTGADDANVLNSFFDQPQLNECGPGPGPQYNRTGRIELKFYF